jgi:hypothetical protein
MISEKTLSETLAYLNEHGAHETCAYYGITPDSLERYKRLKNFNSTKQPKILLLDIETAPCQGTFWKPGHRISIGYENITKDWFIICWSARWLFSDQTMGECVTSQEALAADDNRILRVLWNLMEQADILVGHNISGFDLPKINTRMMLNDIMPPSPSIVLDTLSAAQHHSFSSNRLDYLAKLVTRKGKIKTEYDLWKRCLLGDQEALDYMIKYCKEDSLLLEEVYLFLRPWMRNHPNLALMADVKELTCGVCLHPGMVEIGNYYTGVNSYSSYRCPNCGALARGRKTLLTKDQSKVILSTTLRNL